MYNPLVGYDENLRQGPAPEWNRGGFFPEIHFSGKPQFSLFGLPLYLPLGVPAGPLLSTAYVRVALKAGFCMPVYKTVRSRAWPSHPWPNVLRLNSVELDTQIRNAEGHLAQRPRVEVVPLQQSYLAQPEASRRLSITNAFGVPSLSPDAWSSDFSELEELSFSDGRLTVLSFQGSRVQSGSWSDFLEDTAQTSRLAAACVSRKGGRVLEMNVSCPNEAGAPIYTDIHALSETLRAAADGLSDYPDVKLIIKLGVVADDQVLPTVEAIARYAHGISAINTVSATILTPEGQRALGSGAEHGGVCGFAIRNQALEMVRKFQDARRALGLISQQFALVGVGGCTTVVDFEKFLEAGADVVHVATGAMWNLQFASECAQFLNVKISGGDFS